jgi:hypothetical protein
MSATQFKPYYNDTHLHDVLTIDNQSWVPIISCPAIFPLAIVSFFDEQREFIDWPSLKSPSLN